MSKRRYYTKKTYIPPRGQKRASYLPYILILLGTAVLCGSAVAVVCAGSSGTAEPADIPQDVSAAETASVADVHTEPEPTADATPWNLTLVNANNPLPQGFHVPEITILRNGNSIDSRAYPSLQAMMDAARAEGLRPLIISSYRTREKQEELFEAKVAFYVAQELTRDEAEHMAAFWVARPDTSEHQLGLAVDIVDEDFAYLDERQEDTDVQKWLMEHCAEYGFILRYPTDKSEITGIGYEPWHYRYVGVDAAKEIMSSGVCLEEYLENFN